jgi:hypothetical protein
LYRCSLRTRIAGSSLGRSPRWILQQITTIMLSRICFGFFFALSLAGLSRDRSVFAQDLFPQVNPPLLVPEADGKKASPFKDEVEMLQAPKDKDKSGGANSDKDLMAKGAGSLNNLFSHQWVRTASTGLLKGSVVTLSGEDTLSVSGTKVVLAQRGKPIANTTSGTEGEFSFPSVAPGYYSIIAEADNSFATYGLAVLDTETGKHLPESVEIRVIRPKGDGLRRIIGIDLVPSTLSGTSDNEVRDPISAKRTFAKSHRVLSSENGRVVGRLSTLGMAPELVDMSQMKVMLLREGTEIGRSNVTEDGQFKFEEVTPGCYGFVAAGNRGVAAVAFCVIKPEEVASYRATDGSRYVAFGALQDTAVSSLNVELADGADVMTVQDTQKKSEEEAAEEEQPYQNPPVVGNMFGAGQIIGGGGSSTAGLGDALRGLVGIGALAGFGAFIADQLDDEGTNSSNGNLVVTPVTR